MIQLINNLFEDNRRSMMDWNKLYNQWQLEKLEGQPIINKQMIKKFNNMNEYNRELYVDYHNYFLNKRKGSLTSYKNYRSKLIDFLTDSNIRNKKLHEITQEDLDNYLYERLNNEKSTTFTSRIDYIKDFLIFHKDKLQRKLVFDNLRYTSSEIEKDKENKATPLTCEQVEKIREIYYTQPTKLFAFEMIYNERISLKELKLLKYKLFHKDLGVFILSDDTRIKVPEHLFPLIDSLKEDKFFNSDKSYSDLINEVKKELREHGVVQNFKYSDIIKTVEDMTFIKCPECGKKSEAIVDYWCAKQYNEGTRFWIVCKKCGEQSE